MVGEFRVLPASHRLRRGDAEIQLEPKVMGLLLYLVEHAGDTVDREQLFEALWPGVVVTDDTLTQAVIKLRKALGDSAREPRYVQTVPKRGYRMCAAVRPVPATGPSPRGVLRRRVVYPVLGVLILLAAGLGPFLASDRHDPPPAPGAVDAVVDSRPSLTVQPFVLLGEDESQRHLAQGLTYDLITDLSKLSGLQVIGSRSIMGQQGEPAAAPDVRYRVVGEVERVDQQLRVHAHLLDARSGRQIWSERYHRPFVNLFEIQEDISRQVVSSLAIQVNAEERRRLARRYTNSLPAYEAFLRAQALLLVRSRAENAQARRLYRQAIDLDPSFARAYGGLALSFAADFRNQWAPDGREALERAGAMARTALEIDPEIPEVYWVLAYVSAQRHRHEQALGLLRKAISLDPSFADAYALMGGVSTYVGRPFETLGLIRTATRLNPDAGYLYFLLLGRAYFFLEDWSQALINLDQALQRNPANLEAHIYRAAVLESAADHDAALWEREEVLALQPDFSAAVWLETYPMTDQGQNARLLAGLARLGL